VTGLHPLSALDSAFLALESDRTPMHYASLGIFGGGGLTDAAGDLRLGAIRELLEQRLARVPALRRKLAYRPTFSGAVAVWVEDPRFDVDHHVRVRSLATPGDEPALLDRTAELLRAPIDRAHPLWELWFLTGLSGGRVAVLEKIHHSLADGLAGVEIATLLFDAAADAGPPPSSPPHPRPPAAAPSSASDSSLPSSSSPARSPPTPTPAVRVLEELERVAPIPARAVSLALGQARHPFRTTSDGMSVARGLWSIMAGGLIAPRHRLNRAVGSERRIVLVRQPLEEIHRAAAQAGATVNDVLLAATGTGIGDLLRGRGERVEGSEAQILVPVGLGGTGTDQFGNHVSALVVRVPLGAADPGACLQAVARTTALRKHQHQAAAAGAIVGTFSLVPQPVVDLVARAVHHQPFVTVVVTNVPGPGIPLSALGSPLIEAFPVVPLAGNLPVGIAALSYGGQLSVGVLADPLACPDLDILVAGMERAFRSLRHDVSPPATPA